MKKSLTILLMIILILPFIGCNEEDNDIKQEQEYTSLIIKNADRRRYIGRLIVAIKKDNIYHKITEFTEIEINTSTEEYVIKDNTIKEVYVFLITDMDKEYWRLAEPIILDIKKKNIFIYKYGDYYAFSISDTSDQTQFPE